MSELHRHGKTPTCRECRKSLSRSCVRPTVRDRPSCMTAHADEREVRARLTDDQAGRLTYGGADALPKRPWCA